MDTRVMAVLPGMWARGAEICTLNLLGGLKAMGYSNLFFHGALRQALPSNMELHLKTRYEDVAEVTHGIHRPTEVVHSNLEEAVNFAKPDILVYSFDKSYPSFAPKAKSVCVVHGIAENDFGGYHPTQTDAVVCVSAYAAALAPNYGIPRQKLYTIPNGVPKAVGTDRRYELGIPQDAWVWCWVGALNRFKRPQHLIAALARREREDEYAIFAGFIDTGMRLDEYATALGVSERCIFLGHVDAIGDVYNSSNCLVVTSERESMPLTIMEAMSVGLGIVSTDVGGIPEMLEPTYGYKYTESTGESGMDINMDYMRTLASSSDVPGRAVGAWEKSYSVQIMTKRYDSLFRQLLAR